VCNIAVQTIIAVEPAMLSIMRSSTCISAGNLSNSSSSSSSSFFEVFGFDILLDKHLRAWLLEVNTCPALNADSALDHEVKTSYGGRSPGAGGGGALR